MLWKYCTQHASKFGKLSSGQGLEKVSLNSNPKERQYQRMPKLLHNCIISHEVKSCSKPGFSNTWTVNFQMFKLDLEKAEEPEIRLPISVGSLKNQENSRPLSPWGPLDAFDCVDHNTLWKILKEMGIPDHLTCRLRNLYAGQEATVKTGDGTIDWFQIGKGVR